MSPAPGRFARCSAFVLAAAFLGSGCVAFNVGEPETFTHTDRIAETATAPLRTEILSANAQLQKNGAEAVVGLGVAVQEEFEKREHAETVTVRKQKRLSIGLFPGAAELFLMPSGALSSMLSARDSWSSDHYVYSTDPRDAGFQYAITQSFLAAVTCGFIPVAGTFYSLLYAPFDDWSCSYHDFYDPDFVEKIPAYPNRQRWDTSSSPRLRALHAFSSHDRKRIGVTTCFDGRDNHGNLTPFGLVGCHKYLAVFVGDPVLSPPTVVGTETKRRNAFATGPFIAEFSIPALSHNDWKRVAAGSSQAAFALPAAERDCMVEAVVSFREDVFANGRDASDFTRQALAKAAGQTWRFNFELKGTGRPSQQVVVKEIHHYHETPAVPARRFDIQKNAAAGGRTVWRVTILDESLTAFDADSEAKPEILRNLRDEFLERNPSVRPEDVRAYAGYTTENGGRVLVYIGAASSMIPSLRTMSYDAASRRGTISMKLADGAELNRSKSFVRENIGAIVCDKNVVLTSGQRPPDGATYRSLDENFADGILTVEFEAVE